MNGSIQITDIFSAYLLYVLLFSDSRYADRISLEELISYRSVAAIFKMMLFQDGHTSCSKCL